MKSFSLAILLSFALSVTGLGQSRQSAAADDSLTFQTGQPWTPRTQINAGAVMVYGIDDTTAERIRGWRAHGYHVSVMTGVAWGRYAPYLRGDFDGKQHWDQTQQEKSGQLILHSGREVPYISPDESYGNYLAQGVLAALDAGAEAIYLEEPEFWARAGWSESFKRSWQQEYHETWRAPDSSPDAQYRASKLKYALYRRALAQVFAAVKQYGAAHGRTIPCYVATHSLINYAQWQIVSPESSLLGVGADGYIAQVWTGTARTPNFYNGQLRERTFETAFLEYGALQNIARSSAKKIWYLDDPIEDNPNHSWSDYKNNWESTLVASLLQPEVSRYEVLPWPERIFGEHSVYPAEEPTAEHPAPARTPIPQTYATELQAVFHALGQLPGQTGARWLAAGTEGVGVLVSDTLMFERAAPSPSDANLGDFYGLAMPLLMHGLPVEPVQIESASQASAQNFLHRYKILLLTYDGQKPPTPQFHDELARWVRAGGALVVVDDDQDPYNRATDWWNTGGKHFATPREDLFQKLGLAADEGLHKVGAGCVLYARKSPSQLSRDPDGAEQLLRLFRQAAGSIHLPVRESSALVLRRGVYIVAAGLDATDTNPVPFSLHGRFVDLFDANLPVRRQLTVPPGTRAFWLDLDALPRDGARIVAQAGAVSNEAATANRLSFTATGIEGTRATVRIAHVRPVRTILVGGKPLPAASIHAEAGTTSFEFLNVALGQKVEVLF